MLHHLIAVTPSRLCLGVLDTYHGHRTSLKCWLSKKEKNREGHNIPTEEKESYRWVASYQKAQAIAPLVPETRLITVADRESDLYDLYLFILPQNLR